MHRPKLLCVDDDPQMCGMYERVLGSHGYEVVTAEGASEALHVFHSKDSQIDAVISDYEMPGMNGEAVAATIKAMDPKMPVIIFSGNTMVSQRCRRYADAFCDKAGNRDRLLGTIQRLLHSKRISVLQPPPRVQASHHERRTVA